MRSDGLSPLLAVTPNDVEISRNVQVSASPPAQPIGGLSRTQWAIKRGFDVVISLALMLLLAPLMLAISLLIKSTSAGPILFKQTRVGFLDRHFVCLKFRSMLHASADLDCGLQTQAGDLRVTPVGRWLRRMSLDELPQLYNVLRGEMSLVGPRPHALSTKAGGVPFHLALDDYSSRHSVLPGMTGLAQIRGCRGRTATVEDIRRRVDLDLHYIRNWSLGLDLRILFGTLSHLLPRRDVF